MKRKEGFVRGFLVVMISTMFFDVAWALATQAPIVDESIVNQAERKPVEEALLNFRIEKLVERTLPAGCSVELKFESDQKQLDPQLSPSDKRNTSYLVSPDQCKEAESFLPLKR